MIKKLSFSRKQVTTYYLLEFRRINTFHILHQGVTSQYFRRETATGLEPTTT